MVSATSPSGVLEIETADGSLRLEVERGRVAMPTKSDLEKAGEILASRKGEFRFTPGEIEHYTGEVMSLTAFAEAAGAAASNLQIELLLEDESPETQNPLPQNKIHVLPTQPPQNPLDELLSDLEAEAPGDLLFHLGDLSANGARHLFSYNPSTQYRAGDLSAERLFRQSLEHDPGNDRSLAGLAAEGPFDAIFIDATKAEYPAYLDWAVDHIRVGGLVADDHAVAGHDQLAVLLLDTQP